MSSINANIPNATSKEAGIHLIQFESRTNALISLAQQGDPSAVERLLAENSGSLHAVTRNRRYSTLGSPEEIMSLAVIGFMKAIENFDPLRGIKFITYATALMHGAVLEEVRDQGQQETLIPRSLREQLKRIEGATDQLTYELGRMPSTREVADRMNTDEESIIKVLVRVPKIMNVDAAKKEDGEDMDSDILYGVNDPGTEQNIQKQELMRHVAQATDLLTSRQKYVVTKYYGSDEGKEPSTFKQVACELGISESRVYQIHNDAMDIIRVHLTDSYKGDSEMMLTGGVSSKAQKRISTALKKAFQKAFKQPNKYEFYDTPLSGATDLQRGRFAAIQWLGTMIGVSRSATLSDGIAQCAEAIGLPKRVLSNIVRGIDHVPVGACHLVLTKLSTCPTLNSSVSLPVSFKGLSPLLHHRIVKPERINSVFRGVTRKFIWHRFNESCKRRKVNLDEQKIRRFLDLSKREWADVWSGKRELSSHQAKLLNVLAAASGVRSIIGLAVFLTPNDGKQFLVSKPANPPIVDSKRYGEGFLSTPLFEIAIEGKRPSKCTTEELIFRLKKRYSDIPLSIISAWAVDESKLFSDPEDRGRRIDGLNEIIAEAFGKPFDFISKDNVTIDYLVKYPPYAVEFLMFRLGLEEIISGNLDYDPLFKDLQPSEVIRERRGTQRLTERLRTEGGTIQRRENDATFLGRVSPIVKQLLSQNNTIEFISNSLAAQGILNQLGDAHWSPRIVAKIIRDNNLSEFIPDHREASKVFQAQLDTKEKATESQNSEPGRPENIKWNETFLDLAKIMLANQRTAQHLLRESSSKNRVLTAVRPSDPIQKVALMHIKSDVSLGSHPKFVFPRNIERNTAILVYYEDGRLQWKLIPNTRNEDYESILTTLKKRWA